MAMHEAKDDSTNSEADFSDSFFQAMKKKAEPFLVNNPTEEPGPGHVLLQAAGRVLSAHENVLTSKSSYFKKILSGPPEAQHPTKIIDFKDDIDPFFLGVYLHLAYVQSMGETARLPNCGSSTDCRWLTGYVKVYQLAAKFANTELEIAIYNDLVTWLTTNDDMECSEEDIGNSEVLSFWVDTLSFAFHALSPGAEKEARLRKYIARAFVRWLPMKRYSEFEHRIKNEHEFVFAVTEQLAQMVADQQTSTPKQPKRSNTSAFFDHVCESAWEAYLEDLKEVSRAMATNILSEPRLSLEQQASMRLLLARSSRDLNKDPNECIAHAVEAVSLYQHIRESQHLAGANQRNCSITRSNLLLAIDVLNSAITAQGKDNERLFNVAIADAGKTTRKPHKERTEKIRRAEAETSRKATNPQEQGLLD